MVASFIFPQKLDLANAFGASAAPSDIPVINSYSIKAGNTNIWATLADWNEGTFTDAVGYESDDVFNDYSVDYDDYGTVGKNVKVVEGTVSTFTDIAGHWAKDAIEYVTDKALFNGTTATIPSLAIGLPGAY